jgi:hypothetical protein
MDLSRNPRGAPAQPDPMDVTDDPNRTADATAPRYAGPHPPLGFLSVAPDNAYYRWNAPLSSDQHPLQHHNELQPRTTNLQNPAALYSGPPGFNSLQNWSASAYGVGRGQPGPHPHRVPSFAPIRSYYEPHFSSDFDDYPSIWESPSPANELPHSSDYGNQREYLNRRPSNLPSWPTQHEPQGLLFHPPSSQEAGSRSLVQGLEGLQRPAVQYWPTGDLGNQRQQSTSTQPQRLPSEPNRRPKQSFPAHLQTVPTVNSNEPKIPIPAYLRMSPHDSGPPIPDHLKGLSLPPRGGGGEAVDKKTRKKQEAFAKKAELRRQSEPLKPGKRPLAHRNKSNSPVATPAKPAKRPKVGPLDDETAIDNPQYHGRADSSVSEYDPHQLAIRTKALRPAPDWDNLCQPIALHYEEYNWSVQLYELDDVKSGYHFAQPWLEKVYAQRLNFATVHKWFTHVSNGFIKDGGRLSMLVLHNAINPFRSGADSTTSIGVYGRYWHQHNEIYWTTITPGIRDLFDFCERSAFIREKQRWRVDMAKASDRRFHRAYWLAANCLELGNLLNHGRGEDEAHDAVGGDEPIPFTEDDVGSEWDVSADESAAAWAAVLRLNEEMPEPPADGWDYVVTGSSE